MIKEIITKFIEKRKQRKRAEIFLSTKTPYNHIEITTLLKEEELKFFRKTLNDMLYPLVEDITLFNRVNEAKIKKKEQVRKMYENQEGTAQQKINKLSTK